MRLRVSHSAATRVGLRSGVLHAAESVHRKPSELIGLPLQSRRVECQLGFYHLEKCGIPEHRSYQTFRRCDGEIEVRLLVLQKPSSLL